MLICILSKKGITSCSVTLLLFLHLEVKPLMTLTTVLYLSCALISGHLAMMLMDFFFFQAEDGIRDLYVTGVQTCALPISRRPWLSCSHSTGRRSTAAAAGGAAGRPMTTTRSARPTAAPARTGVPARATPA